ncbi:MULTISPECIES: alanyl-tRNA editing protein [Faecalibacterium]|jgi:alanyl-tRNA synthetase|uniref:Alanyl-tRNA editing protein n=2 Tax=Faecalibacterium TaxID=216851 RepID=A0A2A7AS87_9FIRM|nr:MULTISPECIES: alanyl-tRNA editing protein [Faecalibacterium]MBP7956772.1 alanyl-tRNA editing protein [Faecalibacterium sp.]PDX81888.1 alanyl-tRNA editing protein [Faecalibacterium prausnitzii]RAW59214.1 alanyl-tRNA editing protein [Faecalibacterium hattorii]
MQPTQKYYEADAYRREADAVILAAEPDGRGGGKLALDGTVFYPEGGGQPADHGTLTLPDGARLTVTDVHEQGGVIWHRVDALPDTAAPGTAVTGRIDWAWRFDKMQQHTGEHILSGILHQMFGAENVGFHIGSDAVRMDTSVPISAEGLREAELAANRIVWQNVPVLITYPTREELARMTYRSKKEIEGQVRIVTIPGADVCACCGTHTAATGAVGQIKILAAENYKGGVRLSIVCGERALLAAQAMRQRQADIGALLSAKPSETAHAVHRVYDEYTALKFAHFGLCSELFDALAAQVAPGADAIRIVPGLDPDGLHRLAARLSEATTGLCAALTANEKGTGYCLAQAGGDVRALTKALNTALNGRGGGKPGICQGSCAAAPEQVETFLKENHTV